MRSDNGGIARIARIFEESLEELDTGLSRPQQVGLCGIAASLLSTRSVNTTELAYVLPREVGRLESKQRYIWRWLSHAEIDPKRVMHGLIPKLIKNVTVDGKIAVMMIDQTQITAEYQCLIISLAFHGRAQPLAWKVVKMGRGNIGFDEQAILLRHVHSLCPQGVKVMLSADRFYGTQALIGLCQDLGFSYRIRLKGNLNIMHQGAELSLKDAVRWKLHVLDNAILGTVATHIGILHEEGHPEPWIIAMDAHPTQATILDYGLRWGIESMFSDLKTRGFEVTKTQLTTTERIEKLLLILGFATLWAVFVGVKPPLSQPSKNSNALVHPPSPEAYASFMPLSASASQYPLLFLYGEKSVRC